MARAGLARLVLFAVCIPSLVGMGLGLREWNRWTAPARKLAALQERGVAAWGEERPNGLEVRGASAPAGFSDADVEALAGLDSLEVLFLSDTKITDAGLEALPPLPSLKLLYLSNTNVTDRGAASLGRHPRLQELHLDGVPLSDAGLAALAGFRALQTIYLQRTNVTDAGLDRFRRAAPETTVLR